jgi:hypothetical protein
MLDLLREPVDQTLRCDELALPLAQSFMFRRAPRERDGFTFVLRHRVRDQLR